MKKGQIVEGIVEYSEFPNMGVVNIDCVHTADVNKPGVEKKVIDDGQKESADKEIVKVKNVIPGQRVSVRLVKKRNGLWRGNLQEVIEQPDDGESAGSDCDFYGLTAVGEKAYCGSCLYRTIPYEKELEIKSDQIRRLLSPVIPDFDEIFEGVTGSPQLDFYRNKMELSFGDDHPGGELLLGLHRRGSMYDIISCSGCMLMHPDMDEIRRVTELFFRERNISYLHKRTHEGYLRHLLLRRSESTGEILVGLVTTTQEIILGEESSLLEQYRDTLLAAGCGEHIAGILHIKNDRLGDVVVDEGTDILYGRDYITESVLGLEFKITPFSFFQTNTKGAEVLYSKAREYIVDALAGVHISPDFDSEDTVSGDDQHKNSNSVETADNNIDVETDNGSKAETKMTGTLYDLYSGTGTIAQILAPIAAEVIGVEIVEEAVEAAKENASANGLTNCSFIAGDVLKVIDEISTKPDFIILDPPRDGIHPKALPKIVSYGVDNILYISCKASSLARDLPEFMKAGYIPKRVSCIDLFPRTGNIETVALLGKQNGKPLPDENIKELAAYLGSGNAKPDDTIEIRVDADKVYEILDREKEAKESK